MKSAESFTRERDERIVSMWNEGVPVSQIADRLRITNSTIYGAVERRRREGWDVHKRYGGNVFAINHERWHQELHERAARLERNMNDRGISLGRTVGVIDAANLLGISVTTIWRGATAGALRKVSSEDEPLRFCMRDLIEWAGTR